jgi:hypothetical protein
MAKSCRIACDAFSGEGRWQRDGDLIVLSPAAAAPFSLAIGEVSGISGDGFTITLSSASSSVRLEKLGGDGPTLLQDLRRDWPPLRAKLLRLGGDAAPQKMYAGTLKSPVQAGPFRGFMAEDRLVLALDGQDVTGFFLADCRSVAFDEKTYSVCCTFWSGEVWRFLRLGGETQAFLMALQGARDKLAEQARDIVARFLPTLDAGGRAKLSYQWLPGRLPSLAALEALAPGFAKAFAASWLHACPREDAGAAMMANAAPGDGYLGYRSDGDDKTPWLWLLVKSGGSWSLELLSQGDYATYLFSGGDELPGLIEQLIRLPEFSREALYQPLEELTGERAEYAIPARELPMLRFLRARFAGRKIHAPKAD